MLGDVRPCRRRPRPVADPAQRAAGRRLAPPDPALRRLVRLGRSARPLAEPDPAGLWRLQRCRCLRPDRRGGRDPRHRRAAAGGPAERRRRRRDGPPRRAAVAAPVRSRRSVPARRLGSGTGGASARVAGPLAGADRSRRLGSGAEADPSPERRREEGRSPLPAAGRRGRRGDPRPRRPSAPARPQQLRRGRPARQRRRDRRGGPGGERSRPRHRRWARPLPGTALGRRP